MRAAGTPTCDEQCYFIHECGNGVVDVPWGEQCEPPGTATCDAECHFINECGNGVIEPGEECDGQAFCSGCRLERKFCCDLPFLGGACLGSRAYSEFDIYWVGSKPCVVTLGGTGSFGVCEGAEACPGVPAELNCRLGSCSDQPIDPLPLCCQHVGGGCHDTVATTAGAIGAFRCEPFLPPEQGDIDRMMLGTCGDDGRCVPLGTP